MTVQPPQPGELLPHLFRQEYAKMTAVLCRHFGLQYIEAAEDIASETFLKATELWPTEGIPANPTAWLYAVAKNKARDYLRRHAIFETKVKGALAASEQQGVDTLDFTQQTIADSQLAMIFAVCDPSNSAEAQICLALQILCGFSVEEIAGAFLAKAETIKKRLMRARANLRANNFQIRALHESSIRSRLDTVLRTLYLLFNEGYLSKSGDRAIRKDLCLEAMRLTLILAENPPTNTAETNALLALMCFQSSRLDAREDGSGELILYEQQDRSLWSSELIDRGCVYLVDACSGDTVSKYHLEAGIAYWHTTPEDAQKWRHILDLYNQLIIIEYSAITALNRTFAFAKVYGSEQGIREALRLGLDQSSAYHALLGYLYRDIDRATASAHYARAAELTQSAAERRTLAREIARLAQ